jgi:hypothetical protein
MEGIKAVIRGGGIKSSVEFSVEEVIARHQGKPWSDLSDAEREATMKEYARLLFSRQNGVSGEELQVRLEGGTFSNGQDGYH